MNSLLAFSVQMIRRVGISSIQLALLPVLFASVSEAEDSINTNKTQYSSFNPTPQLRIWHTDHAGVSPFTTDAGHFEADVEALSYSHFERTFPRGFDKIESWSFGRTVANWVVGKSRCRIEYLSVRNIYN